MSTGDNIETQQKSVSRSLLWPQFLVIPLLLGLVLYFQYQEGLLPLGFLHGLIAPPVHGGAYTAILSSLFSGGYHVWWENIPWGGFAGATIAIALFTALGWFIVDSFEIYIPRLAQGVISLAVGTGTAGVALELLAMANLLHRWPVVALWVLMFVFAIFFWRRTIQRASPIAEQVGGGFARAIRTEQSREWTKLSIRNPIPGFERVYFFAAAFLIAVISFLVFIHAVAFPETYWDSLILYMGYARKMFLQHGFPTKVVGQVGIGLGANYPHLFPLLSAQTAAVAGQWNDMFAQLMPPVFGLGTTILIYYIALEMTQEKVVSITAALLYRAIPYGIIYNQYASDYALAVFYTSVFLYFALLYCKNGLSHYRTLMLLMAAFAVHINYLMWCLWIVAAAVVFFAHIRRRTIGEESFSGAIGQEVRPLRPPYFTQVRTWTGFFALLLTRSFWIPALVALAVAAPWYIRNVIVTRNPVYAFFYNIFPSKNVNPDVMKSAEVEWLLNGDGLGRIGRTLPEKIAGSWSYFVTSSLHWRLGPVFVAFGVLGFILLPLLGLRRPSRAAFRLSEGSGRFLFACAILWSILWFYAYVIADFYLYQIIIVLPLVAIFSVLVLQLCSARIARATVLLLALLIGFSPGIITGLMGFKLKRGGVHGGTVFSQMQLTPLKNLFIDKDTFYTMEFNGDMRMFDRLRSIPTGRKILTHENRHLLLDERLKIVHLDDWEVQPAYNKPIPERLKILQGLGIDYYLYVPNEDKHRANSWLGMDELIRVGHFIELFRTPSAGSSEREGLDYKSIPADSNVLYRASWQQ